MQVFVKTFIDDIIIFFRTRKKHLKHLKTIFERLFSYEITLNLNKIFIKFSSLILLKQIIDALDLITTKEKLAVIVRLVFSQTLKNLKIYLKLIDWLRQYIFYYAQIFESLQQRKIIFLKNDFAKKNLKKKIFKNFFFDESIDAKHQAYEYLQFRFNKSSFLTYFNANKSFFIDVNVLKKRKFGVMIFHVQNNFEKKSIFLKNEIQSIMFLNKQLFVAKIKSWLTKLEIAKIIWMIKKIRHIIKSCRKSSIIIFTDHFATTDLIQQNSLIISNTNKLNLHFVRASQFLSVFFIKIKIKSKNFHIISNALFRLTAKSKINKIERFVKKSAVLENLNDLKTLYAHVKRFKYCSFKNVLFYHVNEMLNFYFKKKTQLKMNEKFKNNFKNIYRNDIQWNKICVKVHIRQNLENIFDEINFVIKNSFLYYAFQIKIPRLCISWNMKKKCVI